MENINEVKKTKKSRKTSRQMEELLYSKKGAEFLAEHGNKKRISRNKISNILLNFIWNSLVKFQKAEWTSKGGYYEYYLINSDEFSKEEIVDFSMFFNTIDHLKNLIVIPTPIDKEYLTVKDLFHYSGACMIFEYKYKNQALQAWQDQLFRILTLQEFPKY